MTESNAVPYDVVMMKYIDNSHYGEVVISYRGDSKIKHAVYHTRYSVKEDVVSDVMTLAASDTGFVYDFATKGLLDYYATALLTDVKTGEAHKLYIINNQDAIESMRINPVLNGQPIALQKIAVS